MSTFRGKAKRRARAVRKATGRVMVPLGPSPRAPYGSPGERKTETRGPPGRLGPPR